MASACKPLLGAKEAMMGGKIRSTKLTKIEHPYCLEADGKRFTVKIADDGSLHVFTDRPIRIYPYGPQTIVLRLNDS